MIPYLDEALFWLSGTLVIGVGVLDWTGGLPRKWAHGLSAIGWTVHGLVVLWRYTTGEWSGPLWLPLAAFDFYVALAEFVLWWKHRDDDDHDGKWRRLRNWAVSHIPRPNIIPLRPLPNPA